MFIITLFIILNLRHLHKQVGLKVAFADLLCFKADIYSINDLKSHVSVMSTQQILQLHAHKRFLLFCSTVC